MTLELVQSRMDAAIRAAGQPCPAHETAALRKIGKVFEKYKRPLLTLLSVTAIIGGLVVVIGGSGSWPMLIIGFGSMVGGGVAGAWRVYIADRDRQQQFQKA